MSVSAAAGERSPWGSLLFLTGIFYLNFTARVLPTPLAPVLEESFGLSHSGSGLIFLLTASGFLAGMLGALGLAGRTTHRRVIIGSALALGLVLTATALARTSWQFYFGMFSIGMATGVYLPSALPTLTELIPPSHWGKAIGIHELAPSLAFISAPALAELALAGHSWRLTFLGAGAAALGMAALFGRFGTGGRFPINPLPRGIIRQLLVSGRFWVFFLLFCLGIGGSIGTYSMLTLYLVKVHTIGRPLANSLLAISRVATLGTILLGGWGADRLGSRRMMGGALIATGLATCLLGLSRGSWLLVWFFLQPMLAVCFFPAAYSALTGSVPPAQRQLAVSLTLPGAFLVGAGLLPAGIGVLADAGWFAQGFVLAGGLMAGGGLWCLALWRRADSLEATEASC